MAVCFLLGVKSAENLGTKDCKVLSLGSHGSSFAYSVLCHLAVDMNKHELICIPSVTG